jgi:hypothetical protein
MLADDEEDAEGLGTVGNLSERLSTESMFWRLVCSLKVGKDEIDGWTLGEMRLASGYLDMQNDYKRIWPSYYELKKDNNGSF